MRLDVGLVKDKLSMLLAGEVPGILTRCYRKRRIRGSKTNSADLQNIFANRQPRKFL